MNNTEYIITARTECEVCTKGFINLTESQKALVLAGASVISVDAPHDKPIAKYRCLVCRGVGYHEEGVRLLDVLQSLNFVTAPTSWTERNEFRFETITELTADQRY